MLSKEEVLEIISYCDENGINRKDRLEELGIGEWLFYSSRRRYLRQEAEGGNPTGHFIQLRGNGTLVPDSVRDMERRAHPDRKMRDHAATDLKIECQTHRGGLLRISGQISPGMLAILVQNL